MLRVIEGSLFDSDAKYICHQCNCVTRRAAHLAADVFLRCPWADIYSPRPSGRREPPVGERLGDIVIRGDGVEQRFVIGMLGQFYPGRPRFPDSRKDGYEARKVAFAKCLVKIARLPQLGSVAFPWGVGCGAAGGDWVQYLAILKRFAGLGSMPAVDVQICRFL